ncbi:hypothetical protein D1007_50266 [Hordeum vulgare]|nr:hypothetical protein D1007_50266 [Hordeum vulgare]
MERERGKDKRDAYLWKGPLTERSPVPISPPLCFLVDDPTSMDNGDNLVAYTRAILSEEVAYLQAKRAMHQAHERTRATSVFFQNTLSSTSARFFQRRPPTFKLR